MNEDLKILAIQDSESTKNSYYRHPKITPNIKTISESRIEIRTTEESVYIEKLEECILYIIASFKFCPIWLLKLWFRDFSINNGYDRVLSWIRVGLTWSETTSMGVFLRPTRFLLELFKIDDCRYVEIPFGLLNHTCAEERLIFDITMGNENSEIWQILKDFHTLPVYHPLDLSFENEKGTLVVREGDFRLGFRRYNNKELLKNEDEIRQQMKMKIPFTAEFEDLSKFPIVAQVNNELVTQTPDLLIPIPRTDGLPNSFAIEIELSPKTQDKYNKIMSNYQNNIKFGKLFYLCGSQRISNMIKKAYKEVGGLGHCELYLLPFTAPSQMIDDYSIEEETKNKQYIIETRNSTVE